MTLVQIDDNVSMDRNNMEKYMKLLIFGDLHLGIKSDSPKHNQQILDFIDHVCDEYAGKVDSVVQLGDWYDHRSKIQIATLNRGIEGSKRLADTFGKDNVYVLVGNHDCYRRDSLDDNSLITIEPYVTVVNSPLSIDNCYMIPWIVSEEDWVNCVKQGENHDYLFAHLELSSFYMNDHYVMEHGQSGKELRDYTKVFTGHYHSYQEQKNVVYTGTPIPMSQNEANKDMGYVLLDTTTGEWSFEVYDKVQVVSIPYTQLDDVIDTLDPENTSIRVEFPDDLENEDEIGEVIDRLNELSFSDIKTKYKGNKAQKLMETEVDDIEEVENIDKVVVNFIKTSSSVEGIDSAMLESLYSEAKERNND